MTEVVSAPVEDGIKFEPLSDLYPTLDFFLYRSISSDNPLCTYVDLHNGNISMLDLFHLNELMDLRGEVSGRR